MHDGLPSPAYGSGVNDEMTTPSLELEIDCSITPLLDIAYA